MCDALLFSFRAMCKHLPSNFSPSTRGITSHKWHVKQLTPSLKLNILLDFLGRGDQSLWYELSIRLFVKQTFVAFSSSKPAFIYSLFNPPSPPFCAQSYLTPCDPTDCKLTKLLCPCNFPGKSIGACCHFLLQKIFPTQGSNSCFLHWQVDFYNHYTT